MCEKMQILKNISKIAYYISDFNFAYHI